jgi:hypothetical protein
MALQGIFNAKNRIDRLGISVCLVGQLMPGGLRLGFGKPENLLDQKTNFFVCTSFTRIENARWPQTSALPATCIKAPMAGAEVLEHLVSARRFPVSLQIIARDLGDGRPVMQLPIASVPAQQLRHSRLEKASAISRLEHQETF